jgi:hypothetical protein
MEERGTLMDDDSWRRVRAEALEAIDDMRASSRLLRVLLWPLRRRLAKLARNDVELARRLADAATHAAGAGRRDARG